jgi:hypothetical protein
MKAILQGGNIYATNLKYLNDSDEFYHGINVIYNKLRNELDDFCVSNNDLDNKWKSEAKKMLASNKKASLSSPVNDYSISFCRARDKLTQWSMYAKESGVSLGFQFEGETLEYIVPAKEHEVDMDRVIPDEYLDEENKIHFHNKIPGPVTYSSIHGLKDETDAIKDIVPQNKDEWDALLFDKGLFSHTAPLIKRHEFAAEEELRLLFRQWFFPYKIEYRLADHVLKPYIDVHCEGGWPIREIIVGPGFNQDIVYDAICHFLDNTNIKIQDITVDQRCDSCENFLEFLLPEYNKNSWKNKFITKYPQNAESNIQMDFEKYAKKRNNQQFLNQKPVVTKDGILVSKSEIPFIF